MLMFKHKFSAADYQLCCVSKILKDEDKDQDEPLVRTCEVEVAPKNARKILHPNPAYRLTPMTDPVQRWCIFLPVEDQKRANSEAGVEVPEVSSSQGMYEFDVINAAEPINGTDQLNATEPINGTDQKRQPLTPVLSRPPGQPQGLFLLLRVFRKSTR